MFKNAEKLDANYLAKLNKEIKEDKVAVVLRNAANKTALNDLCYVGNGIQGDDFNFSVSIKTLPVANQKQSGRCWLFAATNLFREIVAKKCNLDRFELSQNYIAFCDKIEKVNYALESVIDLLDSEYDDRLFKHIISYPVGDGGQWDMVKNLVKKYGLVPKQAMDETVSSSATRDSNTIINTSIKKFAATAKKLHAEGKDKEVRELKNDYFAKLYRVLCIAFGTPVEKFDFEYTDKEGKYYIDKDLTPKSFYDKYIGVDIDDYVSIINSPTNDKPFYKTYTVDYVGNVIGGNDICYLNLPMKELKEAVIKSLKNGEIVWFGSDCGKFGDRVKGVWDIHQYDYIDAFGLDLDFDKADMLDYAHSAMNHAMVLTAVNLNNDVPTKWKIENSWGEEAGNKGYYVCTDAWFDQFVYQAVVNKKYLNKEQNEMFNQEPKHLNPWDPMGTLAD